MVILQLNYIIPTIYPYKLWQLTVFPANATAEQVYFNCTDCHLHAHDPVYNVLAAWLSPNSTAVITAAEVNNTNTAGESLTQVGDAIFANTPCAEGTTAIVSDLDFGYWS